MSRTQEYPGSPPQADRTDYEARHRLPDAGFAALGEYAAFLSDPGRTQHLQFELPLPSDPTDIRAVREALWAHEQRYNQYDQIRDPEGYSLPYMLLDETPGRDTKTNGAVRDRPSSEGRRTPRKT
jgi:hypothetical protein